MIRTFGGACARACTIGIPATLFPRRRLRVVDGLGKATLTACRIISNRPGREPCHAGRDSGKRGIPINLNRRQLLGGGTAALGAAPAVAQGLVDCVPCVAQNPPTAPSPLRKLRVKPVMTSMLHTASWEGPCRWNNTTVEQETASVRNGYARWVKEVRETCRFGPAVDLLEPHQVVFDEAFTLPAAGMLAIEKGRDKIDAFFVSPQGASFAAAEIARRYHKPVVVLTLNCRTVDVAAYARTIGEEVLVAADNTELERTMWLLRARAAYRETRVLFPTNRGLPSVAPLTGISDLRELERRFGIGVRMISYKELAAEMEKTLEDPAARQKAESAAGELIRGAVESWLDREYVVRSLLFRQAVEALMDTHCCNAFTIECFEFCASRLPEKWKMTPCLAHTLFKDAGIASSCEGDLGALLATRMLLSVSGKSSHMGNMFQGKDDSVVVNHSVPGIRMNGFDQPGLPYKLGRFVPSGWGAKAVVDFMQNAEKRATVARVHPDGTKLLVLRGTLAGSAGWEKDNLGCSVQAFIKPATPGAGIRFIRRQTEYGNHLSWVYGDYGPQPEELGRLLGIEVEVIS